MLDINEVERKFELLKVNFTPLQRSFLDCRRTTNKDVEAARLAGVSTSTVRKWKMDKPDFMHAYALVVDALPDPRRVLMIPEGDRQQIVRSQVDALSKMLPQVVGEHIKLALHASNEAVKMKAIEKLYEVCGLGPDTSGMSKSNKTLVQLVNLIGPQLKKIAGSKGIVAGVEDIPGLVEGDYEELIEEGADDGDGNNDGDDSL